MMMRALALVVVVLPGSAAGGQETPTDPRLVVRVLLDEARQFAKDGTLVRSSPTIAADHPLDLDDRSVAARLVDIMRRPAATQSAADAYIRWQLTSYRIDLSGITDSQFEMLLSRLPSIKDNPLGDREVAQWVNSLRQQERFPLSQQEGILERFQILKDLADDVASENVPALAFRQWLIDNAVDHSPRSILLQVERLSTLIKGHWPARGQVASLDRSCESADRSTLWTRRQLSSLRSSLHALIPMTSPVLERLWFQEEVVYAQWGATGIQDFDVRRWIKAVSP